MVKNKIIRLLAIFLLFSVPLTASVSKAEYLVGVKSGDWMR